jgi:hypothetical protein
MIQHAQQLNNESNFDWVDGRVSFTWKNELIPTRFVKQLAVQSVVRVGEALQAVYDIAGPGWRPSALDEHIDTGLRVGSLGVFFTDAPNGGLPFVEEPHNQLSSFRHALLTPMAECHDFLFTVRNQQYPNRDLIGRFMHLAAQLNNVSDPIIYLASKFIVFRPCSLPLISVEAVWAVLPRSQPNHTVITHWRESATLGSSRDGWHSSSPI